VNSALKLMLEKYKCRSIADWENALREIIQEISLLALWRSKFFEHAAFYGGTALRILYGLDRYSEDLDFSLLKKDSRFKIDKYFKAIELELRSFGFEVSVSSKVKNTESNIESAFIKANTLTNMLNVEVPQDLRKKLAGGKILKVKLEIDKDPPMDFQTEAKYILQPIPFTVNTFKPQFLFAGKLHAVLCRNWKSRVKSRDWYDMVWYVAQGIPVNLKHLRQRMLQTGRLDKGEIFREENLKRMLMDKLKELKIEELKKNILVFLKHPESVSVWSKDFFIEIIKQINCK
jgi:predicted nucleotidyltransferase component of viral defense system